MWKKIGRCLKCLLPAVGYEAAVIMGAILVMLFQLRTFGPEGMEAFMDNLLVMTTVSSIIGLFIMGFWYWRSVRKKVRPRKPWEALKWQDAVALFILALGLQLLVNVLMEAVDHLFPQLAEEYLELLEQAGMLENGFWNFVSAVILAPLMEELTMRGLTMHYAYKAGMKFWTANVVQALLFAWMHGNFYQGSYAFFVGLMLGYIGWKYHSLYAPILLHLWFNLLSGSVESLWTLGLPTPLCYVLFIVVGAVLTYFSVRWIQRRIFEEGEQSEWKNKMPITGK